MKLSMEWLREFVDIDVSAKEYADAMTLSGSKVEGIEELGSDIHHVVVGRIEAKEPHPDADRLSVCLVHVGEDKPIQIVTGATNINIGDMIPVALSGAKLPGGKEIQAGKLRGVMSEGMLCSLSELALSVQDFPYAQEQGIFILQEEAVIGQDIREVLGLRGHTIEFEITNNRPDCLSVIGLARETAATYNRALTLHNPKVNGGGVDIGTRLSVQVEDADLCPRYTARMVRDVKIGPSPRWMRERLRASGVRPINNIVDITNYVMLEYGQPMHAFDYACVHDKTIVVRRARKGETLDTLDGRARALTPDMLLIADARRPVGVAGVMGGANSEINGATTDIVFESANFGGPSVRKTALALGMRTDASTRFEKGLDPTNTVPAVQRACELVETLGAGTVCDGIIDVGNSTPEMRAVTLEPARINALLGTNLSESDMKALLLRLGFEGEGQQMRIPTWRGDVSHMADLAEEVARLYGYDKINVQAVPGATRGGYSEKQRAEQLTGEICRALGYSEIMTYSFIGRSWYDLLGWPEDDPRRRSVEIENPLGEETGVMRTTALPSMLNTLASNEAARNRQVRLFELAMTYHPGERELPEERQMLVMGGYGDMDFFALKGAVETILDKLRVKDYTFTTFVDTAYHEGRCAQIGKGDEVLGRMGEVHPLVSQRFGSDQRLYVAELDFLKLLSLRADEARFVPLPRFPAGTRDLAVTCERDIPVARLKAAICEGAGVLLEECRLFDVYTGSQIAQGRKSVAFALTLRAPDRTLTDQEADEAVRGALDALSDRCGATLR